MEIFTKRNLEERLENLASDASKIKDIRVWLLDHKLHFQAIVRIWFKELIKTSNNKKLSFMYLAHDVIWHSFKDCPEFVKEFSIYIVRVMQHLETVELDVKRMGIIGGLIDIWRSRRFFDEEIQNNVEMIWKRGAKDEVSVVKEVKEKNCLDKSPPPHLTCSVCSGLLDEPVQLPCCKTALCKLCAFSKIEQHNECWFGFCPKSSTLSKDEVKTSPELTIQVDLWNLRSKESGVPTNLKVESNVGLQSNAPIENEYIEPEEEYKHDKKSDNMQMINDKKGDAAQKVDDMKGDAVQKVNYKKGYGFINKSWYKKGYGLQKVDDKKGDVVAKLDDTVIIGLSLKIPEDVIKKYFEKFGGILQVQLLKNKRNRKDLWGSAYISFTEKAVADRVILQRHKILDHWCYAVKASDSQQNNLNFKDDENERKIYVGQITEVLTAEDLHQYFETFGQVRDVHISKSLIFRFAFVEFVDRETTMSVPTSGHLIKGVKVIVSKYGKNVSNPQNANHRQSTVENAAGKKKKTSYQQPCLYGEKCRFDDCKFLHPQKGVIGKDCWYGTDCKSRECKFSHPAPTEINMRRMGIKRPAVSLKEMGNVDTPCKFGGECKHDDCKFSHPVSATREALFQDRWGPMGGLRGRTGPMRGGIGMDRGMRSGTSMAGEIGVGMGNGYYNNGMEQDLINGYYNNGITMKKDECERMKKLKNELESIMENVLSRRGRGGMIGRNGEAGGPMAMTRERRGGGRFDPMGRGSMVLKGSRGGRF